MRDSRATHNQLAVSASHREPGLNQEGILDLGLMVDKSDIIKAIREGELNTDEATGKEEADYIYAKERKVEGSLNFKRLQPQHLALFAAYALGQCASTEVEAGKVYLHTSTPITGDLDESRSNPTLTGVQKLGEGLVKTLFTSLMVDELTLTAAKGDWPKLVAAIKGTGRIQRNLLTETVAGLGNAVSVNLAHQVEGDTAAARLASVHQVRWRKTGEEYWRQVRVTAASSASPAVLTILGPSGAADPGTYEVIYVPEETTALVSGSATSAPVYDQAADSSQLADSAQTLIASEHVGRWLCVTSGAALGRIFKIAANDTDEITVAGDLVTAGLASGDAYVIRQFGWLPIPARVAEPPLYVTQFMVVVGGVWDGSDFLGGRTMRYDLDSISWNIKNSLTPELTPGAGQSQVANQALRGRRAQTLELSRPMKDAVYQVLADSDFSTFGILIEAQGGLIPGSSHNYLARVILPALALQSAEPKVNDERLSEDLKLAVLEPDNYPSVIVQVQNAWPAYAQA